MDAASGGVIRWYNARASVGVGSLGAWHRLRRGGEPLGLRFSTGALLWTRAEITVDQTLRTHVLGPGYRDFERDGSTIWAACGCDWVNGTPVKALVKLDVQGNHDTLWYTEAGTAPSAS